MPLMLPAMFLGMLQAMFIANDISLMDLQGLTRTYKNKRTGRSNISKNQVLPHQRTKFRCDEKRKA